MSHLWYISLYTEGRAYCLDIDLLYQQGRAWSNETEAEQTRFPNLSQHELQHILVDRHSTATAKKYHKLVCGITFKDKHVVVVVVFLHLFNTPKTS